MRVSGIFQIPGFQKVGQTAFAFGLFGLEAIILARVQTNQALIFRPNLLLISIF